MSIVGANSDPPLSETCTSQRQGNMVSPSVKEGSSRRGGFDAPKLVVVVKRV